MIPDDAIDTVAPEREPEMAAPLRRIVELEEQLRLAKMEIHDLEAILKRAASNFQDQTERFELLAEKFRRARSDL